MACSCDCRHVSRFISRTRKEYLNRNDMYEDTTTLDNIQDRYQEYSMRENYDGKGIKSMIQDLSLNEIKKLIYECNMCNCCCRHQKDKPDNLKIFMYNLPFVSERDLEYISHFDTNQKDVEVFVREMKKFFEKVWSEEWIPKLKILESGKIEELNHILCDYPSTGGYHILEDSFCFVEEQDIDILSDKSKDLLGYFYGIHLH